MMFSMLREMKDVAKDMETWPRQIKAYEELPKQYQHFFEAFRDGRLPFPYIVFIPAMQCRKRNCKEKLLCLTASEISIYEKDKEDIVKDGLTFESIHSIEEGTVLLYSWIKVHGEADGKLKTIQFEFNTVTKKLFHSIILKLRKGALGYEDRKNEPSNAKIAQLKEKSYKFMNYGLDSLLCGQEIKALMFQPSVYEKAYLFFKRLLSPAQLHLLTAEEYILIQEEEDEKNDKNQYSGIWRYIPLKKLRNIEVRPIAAQGVIELSLKGDDSQKIQTILGFGAKEELKAYLLQVEQQLKENDSAFNVILR